MTPAEGRRLVGRDEELASIREILAEHRPALIVVSGEVGIGKSALTAAARDEARTLGWQLFPSHATELEVGERTTWADLAGALQQALPADARPMQSAAPARDPRTGG